ncbi:MAG: zinc ribbon domain-containing protein [Vulcanimicrobiaceae bacterium]
MPIYEYQCATCGAITDIKHGFKEQVGEPCPKCGGTELKRLFNAASIVFKGSGFYINDSRKSEAKAESKGETKAEPKSDAKPSTGGKSDAAA